LKIGVVLSPNMNTTNQSIVIKQLNNINGEIDFNNQISRVPKWLKSEIVKECINSTKYHFMGFIDRSNFAILAARYHNVRDTKGRFAKIKTSK